MLILIYFVFAALLSLLMVGVFFNFLRFRFKGDKTATLVVVFIALFAANIIGTLLMIDYTELNPTASSVVGEENFSL